MIESGTVSSRTASLAEDLATVARSRRASAVIVFRFDDEDGAVQLVYAGPGAHDRDLRQAAFDMLRVLLQPQREFRE